MRKMTILFAVMGLLGNTAVAQEYEDLKGLYLDGKYDKLVVKAEKYTQKDKTRNDALPYLYMSKGLFKISMDEKLKIKDEFKNAEMDALTYFGQYQKKDKGKIYNDLAEPHLNEMKNVIYEEVENFYMQKNYKKAIASLKKMMKIEPANIGVNLMKGVSEYLNKNKTEGKANIKVGIDGLKALTTFDSMSDEDKRFMKLGLIEYTNFLLTSKDYSGAKSAITLGYQYYQDKEADKEYIELYNKVVNG